VPAQGAYPLGLDWRYDEKNIMKRTISDYEQQRQGRRRSTEEIERIPEKERKKILEISDTSRRTASMTREESFQAQKDDISLIRKSRQKVGCTCKGGKEGVSIIDEMDLSNCILPGSV
jgi:hypothetical protein